MTSIRHMISSASNYGGAMNNRKIVQTLLKEMKESADPAHKKKHEESMLIYSTGIIGVRMGVIQSMVKEIYLTLKDAQLDEITGLCNDMISTRCYEMRMAAFELAYKYNKKFEKRHFDIFEKWVLEELEDWADCDTLCNHVIGDMILFFPELVKKVIVWSKNQKWIVRRASAVSFILPARRGMYVDEVLKISDTLMNDSHELVLKGYGWALKEASKKNIDIVSDYVMKNKSIMPRVSLRYAVEKFPVDLRKKAMEKNDLHG